MEREHEPVPDVLPDPDSGDNTSDLLAYREYWDGRKWLVGGYVELIKGAETDDFIDHLK